MLALYRLMHTVALLDEVIQISSTDAVSMARELATKEVPPLLQLLLDRSAP